MNGYRVKAEGLRVIDRLSFGKDWPLVLTLAFIAEHSHTDHSHLRHNFSWRLAVNRLLAINKIDHRVCSDVPN